MTTFARSRARLARPIQLIFPFLPVALVLAAAPATPATAAREPRILGGAPAAIEQFPWLVAIAANDTAASGNAMERQFCGGTLVAPTIVVTAAHCVYDVKGEGTGFSPPSLFEAITGRTTLTSSAGQVLEVAEVYYLVSGPGGAPAFEARSGPDLGPELFTPASFRPPWDVAFLRLATPSSSPTIQIAGPDESSTWAARRLAYLSGWGDSPAGTHQDQLQAVEIPIVSDGRCENEGWDIAQTLCAGGKGRGACHGDSGGPLVVPVESATGVAARLVGDVSTADGDECDGRASNSFGRLAADPIRGALQTAIQGLTGVNVVGSGARAYGPPNTKIAKHPGKRTARARARFKLAANEPATFECKLDRHPYTGCGPTFKPRVGRGRHELQARAIDAIGQVDAKPAAFKWTVRRRH